MSILIYIVTGVVYIDHCNTKMTGQFYKMAEFNFSTESAIL